MTEENVEEPGLVLGFSPHIEVVHRQHQVGSDGQYYGHHQYYGEWGIFQNNCLLDCCLKKNFLGFLNAPVPNIVVKSMENDVVREKSHCYYIIMWNPYIKYLYLLLSVIQPK